MTRWEKKERNKMMEKSVVLISFFCWFYQRIHLQMLSCRLSFHSRTVCEQMNMSVLSKWYVCTIYTYKIMCDKRTHCTFAEMIKQNNKIQYPSYLKSAFIRHRLTHTLNDWNANSYSIIQRPTCKESEGTMWKNVITAKVSEKREIFKLF